jgi:cellulose synthase operon protein C
LRAKVEGTTALTANRIDSADGTKGRLPTSRSLILVCLSLAAIAVDARGQQAPPADAESLAQRACQLADAGKLGEVEPILTRLARLHPASNARLAAALFASERAYACGDRQQAASWLKPLAASAPQQFQKTITAALAWCDVDPADLDLPSARLLELADEHGATSLAPVALQLRAEKLAAAKRTDEAIFVYHGLLGRFPKSRHAAGNMLSLAELHFELVQDREAWQWLEKLVAEHPKAPEVASALSLGAQTARRMKNDEASQQWLERLVDEHHASDYWPDAVCRLTERQLDAGQPVAAEERVAEALERAASNPAVRHRLLFLQLRLAVTAGELDAVEQRSQKLIQAKPAEPLQTLAGFWHAEAAYRDGQLETAYTRFLDLSLAVGHRQDDWLGIVPLRLAQIEAQRQKWPAALERAELLAKERPEYSRIHEVEYLRGRALVALGRFNDAREALAKACLAETGAGTETAAMAQWMIGETWFQQQRYEQAIAAYKKTLSCSFPQWQAAALLQAGKCCEHLSRWTDASDHYRQVLAKHRGSRYAADAQRRLATTQQRATLAVQPSNTGTR